MRVIKRDGTEVQFDSNKIVIAISKAAKEVPSEAVSENDLHLMASLVYTRALLLNRTVTVEEVQEMVETAIMEFGYHETAKHYIRYRYEHNIRRNKNSIDDKILSLVEYANEEVKQENSNKNPEIIPTQRDYMAGEISRDLTRRYLLPEEITHAHDEGIIHFHDSDYAIQHIHNCDLINLQDMLQNGTVISGVLIEKPHSFSTACNIATQIIAQVASSQYGGQTITLSHLAPFVHESRKRIRERLKEEMNSIGKQLTDEELDSIVESRVRNEVKNGVQTIQYQVTTLMTTNGQAPFISVFMYLNEVPDGQIRDDLAMIIEEVLRQRFEGVKNEQGVWITPAFPKLLYCLDENNAYQGSKYFYLTELAAKCSVRRLVPDYISAKIMRRDKINKNGSGDVYPCMGK